MNRIFAAILLLLLTAAISYFGLLAGWDKIAVERSEIANLIKLSEELAAIRQRYEELLKEYNTVPSSDLSKVGLILPRSADNAKVLADYETLTRKSEMVLNKLDFITADQQSTSALTLTRNTAFTALPFSLELKGTYEGFRSFLTDLEGYVRLTDITEIKAGLSEGSVFQANLKGQIYYQK